MKAPALKGTTLEESQLVKQITSGNTDSKAPHQQGHFGSKRGPSQGDC